MRLSCGGFDLSLGDLVEIYNVMFKYQVSIGLLPLILIVSANEVEL